VTLKTLDSDPLPIIFDNTVLSNFALAQCFDLLQKLYTGRAFVCKAVLKEIEAGIESGWKYPHLKARTRLRLVQKALEDGWLKLPGNEVNPIDDVVELRLTLEYAERFGAGEAEAMAIARCRDWIFASDDGPARKFAKEQRIHLTGSVGILIKSVNVGELEISLADALHARMIDEGYHSPLNYVEGISTFLKRSPHQL
jgi:predicted nucleic acid-binding protein